MKLSDICDDESGCADRPSSLISKNITIMGRRTSVRLEPEMWTALFDIANRENCTIHELCTLIHLRKRQDSSLTASIRVFLMLYYKAAATEDGHKKSGHGNFEMMKVRARVSPDLRTMRRPATQTGLPIAPIGQGGVPGNIQGNMPVPQHMQSQSGLVPPSRSRAVA